MSRSRIPVENGLKSHENSQKLSQTPKLINPNINTTIQQQNPLNPLIKPQLNHVITPQNLKFAISPNPKQKHSKTQEKPYLNVGEDAQWIVEPPRSNFPTSNPPNNTFLMIFP